MCEIEWLRNHETHRKNFWKINLFPPRHQKYWTLPPEYSSFIVLIKFSASSSSVKLKNYGNLWKFSSSPLQIELDSRPSEWKLPENSNLHRYFYWKLWQRKWMKFNLRIASSAFHRGARGVPSPKQSIYFYMKWCLLNLLYLRFMHAALQHHILWSPGEILRNVRSRLVRRTIDFSKPGNLTKI